MKDGRDADRFTVVIRGRFTTEDPRQRQLALDYFADVAGKAAGTAVDPVVTILGVPPEGPDFIDPGLVEGGPDGTEDYPEFDAG